MTEAKGLHSTLVVNCVLNSFLSSTAILLNIITIQALRKTPSLSKPLKTLLLSLAVSDLGVGFLVQPTYVAVLVMKMKQNADNGTYYTIFDAFYEVQNFLFVFASFFGVFALTVDRFLAIHLHLRLRNLSQAGCCCSELSLGFNCLNCLACFEMDTGSQLYLRNYSYCVLHSYRLLLLEDVRCHLAPCKPDKRSATISTDWRHGECCKAEKKCSCYILCVFGVFSLLFTNILYWCCKNPWWNSLVIAFIGV